MSGDPTGRISHLPWFHRGVSWKQPCRVATTANITISTALNNGDTIDGVTLATGDRVLVKDQSTASQNGIYIVGAPPIRDFDMDQDGTTDVPAEEVMGAFVYVIAGTTNGGTLWHTTNTSAPTLGSTSITWEQFSGFDGTALTAAVFGYQAHGNLGSTETFDSTAAGWHSGTLNADCTFTFTAGASGTVSSMVLELTQDGTGGRAITYPGSVVGDFSGYDTTAGTTSLLMFFTRDGGTTWFGFIAGGSGGSALTVKDEGSSLDTAVTSIDVTGAWATATNVGHAVTLAVPARALDDLTDATITSAATADRLRYNGSAWVNSALIWTPLTVYNGTDWLPLVDGDGNAIMAEA